MRKAAWSFPIVLILLAFQQGRALQSNGTVTGVILELGTNKPLAGVTVSLDPPTSSFIFTARPNLKSGVTNNEGHFTIENVEPGRYRAAPGLEGYVYVLPSRLSIARDPGVWVQVSAGAPASQIEMKMQREGVITGRVLDAQGKPIADTRSVVDAQGRITSGTQSLAFLMRYGYNLLGKRELVPIPGIRSQPMNDMGEYRFYGLPPGDYYLGARGGSSGGNPPRIPVAVLYPGTVDETKAELIHVKAGDEIRLNTMTFQSIPAVNVRFKFVDIPGNPPFARQVNYTDHTLSTFSPAPSEMTLAMTPGHYDFFTSTPVSSGRGTLDVGTTDAELQFVMTRSVRVTAKFFLEDSDGKRTAVAQSALRVQCSLRSQTASFNPSCSARGADTYFGAGAGFNPEPPMIPLDTYRLEVTQLPSDLFVTAATISGKDVLRSPLTIEKETEIEIVLSSASATISGAVRDAKGDKLPDAVLVLLPEEPLREEKDLTRTLVSDVNGNFQIRGVAPGRYRLFAWPELEANAHLNTDFMKPFNERGKLVEIEKGAKLSVDVTAF